MSLATLDGHYFVGDALDAEKATLLLSGGSVEVVSQRSAARFSREAVRATPRVGRADRFVVFPDGGQFQCSDSPLLDALPQEVPEEGIVSWLEARWPVALVALMLTLTLFGLGYRYGLPALAKSVAPRIPIEAERDVGNRALEWLESNHILGPSQVDDEVQTELRRRLTALVEKRPVGKLVRLEFRSMGQTPNAFALPGGTLILTDAMVGAAESYEELMAVLAHEVGHVERRHAVRLLIEGSVLTVAVAAVAGDAGAATVGTTLVPTLLLQSGYSREHETEADTFAFDLLRENGLSPALFADIMERLDPDDGKAVVGSFLSTHPDTAERARAARAAARP